MICKLSLTFCLSLLCVAAGDPNSQSGRVHLAANSSTPVLDIAESLIAKYGWNINYEDWGNANNEDLREIERPTGARLRVRRASTIAIDIPSPGIIPKHERGEIMRQILNSHRSGRPSIVFGYSDNGGTLQVYPVAVRQANGVLQNVTPLLDTPVSLSPGTYLLGQLVNEVIAQIEQKRGVSLVLGTVPSFLFQQDSVTEEAAEEPARNLLLRAFADINGPRLARKDDYVVPVWSIRFEPTGRMFYLNVGFAERIPFSEIASGQVQRQTQEINRSAHPESAPGGLVNPFEKIKQ